MMRSSDQAILIIEDNAPTRELYLRELSRDYRVFACSDEQDALKLLLAHDISVIVLEPGICDGRGWELMTVIKPMVDPRLIPIILCSTQDERKRGMELGASMYLIKPVLPAALRDAIRRTAGHTE